MKKHSDNISFSKLIISAFILLVILGILLVSSKYNAGNSNEQIQALNATSTLKTSSEVVLGPLLSLSSDKVIQGEPVLVRLTNVNDSSVKSLTFRGTPLLTTSYGPNKMIAFVGIDLKYPPGTYSIRATIKQYGTSTDLVLTRTLSVVARPRITAPLGIPDKLGGNTPLGEQNIQNSMASDNAVLDSFHASNKALWTGAFDFPVVDPVVTDSYGYDRLTGSLSISHKGTDFKAATGTPVMAVNNGKVIYTGDLGIYGNTIAIDHGLGILSFYMHLSTIGVSAGDFVARGQVIGQSGDTGYAVGPHLHLTIRINGISIDPMTFLRFFE